MIRHRQAAVVFVLITLGVDALGIGLVVPIVPELVRNLTGLGAGAASLYMGPLVATFALAQLFAAPVIGSLSDRFGRRPVLLASLAGLGVNYVLLAFATSLPWLFAGRAVAGATSANFSTATAYIADVSTPAERAKRFGLVGATFSVGFVIGPAVGGLLGGIDLRLPFVAAAILSAGNMVYGVLVLPESLPAERRQPFSWRAASPIGSFRLLASDRVLRRLAIAWLAIAFGLNVLQTVFVLSNGLRFGWSTEENGLALGLVGVCSALVQIFLVRRVVVMLGEARTGLVGFLCGALSYFVMAVAASGWEVVVAVVLQAFGGLATPSARAMASVRAGPERQGRIMGALSVVEGLTAVISPLLLGALFSAMSGTGRLHFPGAPFLAGSVVYLIGGLAIWRARASPESDTVA